MLRLAVSLSVSALSSERASSLSRRLEKTNQIKSVFSQNSCFWLSLAVA